MREATELHIFTRSSSLIKMIGAESETHLNRERKMPLTDSNVHGARQETDR